MLQKNVKHKIKKKFYDFLDSIDNDKIKDLIEENSIITGGAISSLILDEKINDYDLYFTNQSTVQKVAKYYLKKFIENNAKASECSVKLKEGRIKIYIPSSLYVRLTPENLERWHGEVVMNNKLPFDVVLVEQGDVRGNLKVLNVNEKGNLV